jgi:hypothetical protein
VGATRHGEVRQPGGSDDRGAAIGPELGSTGSLTRQTGGGGLGSARGAAGRIAPCRSACGRSCLGRRRDAGCPGGADMGRARRTSWRRIRRAGRTDVGVSAAFTWRCRSGLERRATATSSGCSGSELGCTGASGAVCCASGTQLGCALASRVTRRRTGSELGRACGTAPRRTGRRARLEPARTRQRSGPGLGRIAGNS